MNKTIGRTMLALLAAAIIAIMFVAFGWLSIIAIGAALLMAAWVVIAINLITGCPPFDFPGITSD